MSKYTFEQRELDDTHKLEHARFLWRVTYTLEPLKNELYRELKSTYLVVIEPSITELEKELVWLHRYDQDVYPKIVSANYIGEVSGVPVSKSVYE